MEKKDFYFDLPQELIAQRPLEDRAASRLLTLDKKTGETRHGHFTDILDMLGPKDCIVINNTKVIPARLMGRRVESGEGEGDVEILLLNNKGGDVWEVLTKPGKWAKPGQKLSFGDILSAEVLEIVKGGNRLVKFAYHGIFEEILDTLGEMPLPPYITEKLEDKNRYQTVYAKEAGSAAAPTAGLHFTEELLDKIRAKGVKIAFVTLHVGLGTFRPVKTEKIEEHEMHSEFFVLEPDQAQVINQTREAGGKIIAIGTTSVRTLESCGTGDGKVAANSGYTGIFIYPGYEFKVVDGLITNFHLPESTLIMLVSALSSREYILAAYKEAVERRYRFFSFGDAMFIC